MSEENNTSKVDDKCCLDDAKPMEISVETMDEEVKGDDDDVVLLPAAETSHVSLRRFSTGVLDHKRAGKAQVQTRYRGNQTSSTHDLCKHGKRREDDFVVKPWKLVKKNNVQVETTLSKSFGNVSKPVDKSPPLLRVAKREAASETVKSCDGLRVKKSETKITITPSDFSALVRMVKKTNLDVNKVSSRISENKKISPKKDLLIKNTEKTKIDECDYALAKSIRDAKKVSRISENKKISSKEDLLKNKEKTKIDETEKCDDASLEKTNLDDVEKVSRTSDNKSSKEDLLKKMKNKTKKKTDEPVRSNDALEKTLYVVESSIEKKKKQKKSITSVKSEIQPPSEKKILRSSGKKSLSLIPSFSEVVKDSRVTRSDPRPIRQQTTSRSKTGFSEKKETASANLVTNSKMESKIIRPKRIGLKVTPPHPPPPTKQLMDFKKGKLVEPKPEDSTSTLLKFKKRVVQEPKLKSDVNRKKKNLKDKREGVVGKINGEGKREKVVLRHRKVEVKKKLQTLFNNVIEETVNKLEEARKSKVKALVGAFETVISLQDEKTKTSQKKMIQSKPTSSIVVEG